MRCLLLLASVTDAVRRGHSHTPFDQDPFVFDPKGRLLQLDYADTAASKGAPCVGPVSYTHLTLPTTPYV